MKSCLLCFFAPADAQQLAELDKTINDYVKTKTAKFIIGEADIDKEWSNYVSTLDKMNLKKYLEIYQKALDAKKKKKNNLLPSIRADIRKE